MRQSHIETIAALEKALKERDEEIVNLKENKAKLEDNLEKISKVFNRDQVYRLLRPDSKGHWSEDTLEMAIKLYYKVGCTGYDYLREKLGWPLPAAETINWHMRKITFKPGISEDIFKLISYKVQTFKEEDKHCGLVIDEMSTTPKLEWDSTNGEFVGYPTVPPGPALVEKRARENTNQDDIFACHVFNVMIVGITIRFKQLLAYHHTDRSWDAKFIAEWLIALIRKLTSIGLNTCFITMDMGKMNMAL